MERSKTNTDEQGTVGRGPSCEWSYRCHRQLHLHGMQLNTSPLGKGMFAHKHESLMIFLLEHFTPISSGSRGSKVRAGSLST